MNGNTIVAGNQINHNLPEKWIILVICGTIIVVMLISLTAFAVWCATEKSEASFENASIQIGPRGGVFYVTESGERKYIDRERGMKLYLQQKDKRDAKQ